MARHWGAPAAASVIIEIFLTLVVVYLFTAIGLMLLAQYGTGSHEFRRVLAVFLLSLARSCGCFDASDGAASVLERLKRFMHSFAGESAVSRERHPWTRRSAHHCIALKVC